ncbi:MAG TPA: glycosyltransferase family 1 protein [Elusimicrobiota bacterium]|nr:glycosyltransferase family 1 protein [Elusimicrobiota bacterium]
MKRTVLINGRFLGQPVTGVQRYAREVLSVMGAMPDNPFHLVLACPNRPKGESFGNVEILNDASPLPGAMWQQIRLPWIIQKTKADLLWSPCNIGPLFAENHVVTIHDASVFAHPECFSPLFRAYYRAAWKSLGRRARLIITDSNFSKNELIRYRIAKPEKIRVVYAGHREMDASAKPQPIVDGPYVLTVGSRDPRKNLGRLLQAWEKLGTSKKNRRLIVAGGGAASFSSEKIGKVPSDVVFTGHVPDEKLAALYAGADAFLFPSLYEGFGMPPLEAMSSGIPVAVSDIPVLREMCGNAAVYVNPTDPDDIRHGLHEILSDTDLRRRLVEKGRAQVGSFTWDKTAAGILNTFREILNEGENKRT